MIINGPSVGFHLKNIAETSSLKYIDYLNCSFVWINNFLYSWFNTGGYRNWLVCWSSLCKLPILLSFFSTFYRVFYSHPKYRHIVIPIFHPLNFFVPAFLKIIFSIVGWVSDKKYWGFLHQLGLSLISPFFFPMPSSLISIFLEPPAVESVHRPSTVVDRVYGNSDTSNVSGDNRRR